MCYAKNSLLYIQFSIYQHILGIQLKVADANVWSVTFLFRYIPAFYTIIKLMWAAHPYHTLANGVVIGMCVHTELCICLQASITMCLQWTTCQSALLSCARSTRLVIGQLRRRRLTAVSVTVCKLSTSGVECFWTSGCPLKSSCSTKMYMEQNRVQIEHTPLHIYMQIINWKTKQKNII